MRKGRIVLLSMLTIIFLFSFSTIALAEPEYRLEPAAGGTNPTNESGTAGTGFISPSDPTATNPLTVDSIKWDSDGNQVIHSNYSANTDACASCHATHTAVGAALLQWEDEQTACWACHDGTLTNTYNVQSGYTNGIKNSGGLFGTGTELGLSNHGMTPSNLNAMLTAAAPGGAEDPAVADSNGNWGTTFTCAACHSPHGQGGNDRILNANVNEIAVQNKVVGETLEVVTAGSEYKGSKANWIKSYPFGAVIYVDGVKNYSATVNYRTGVVTFGTPISPTAVVTADYYPGIYVVMDIQNKLTASETVSYVSGMNTFCGACHTDYNNEGKVVQEDASLASTNAGSTLMGDYRKAYRHQVGFNWHADVPGLKFEDQGVAGVNDHLVNCLTCHFAHGTDDDFAGGTFTDTSRSSALKRLPNMGVCEACHQKGAASTY